MIEINILDTQLRRKLKAIYDKLRPAGRRRVMRGIGRALRDAVRLRFTTQGNGTWRPLGHWVTLKTGRRKALLPLRGRIHYRLEGDNTAEVYFDAPTDEWGIAVHDKGGVSPPVDGKRMAIPLRAGYLVLNKRGASVIPARRIWLTPAETRRIVNQHLAALALEIENA